MASSDYEGVEKEFFLPQLAGEEYEYELLACCPAPAAAEQALESLHQHGFAEADARQLGTARPATQ